MVRISSEEVKEYGDLPEGVFALSLDSPDYPENLRSIPDPPRLVFVKGNLLPRDRISVAIVGTRKATAVGREIAYEMARGLAAGGVTIVSGLALGIDSQAHKGALDAGGRTIACMGTGVDVIYPASNSQLAGKIVQNGCLLSQYPPGETARPWYFPDRNRIISGLALGVVVVEAGEKSGALITADWALKQGRPVMAVPGSPKSWASVGTNRLIQEGAYLVTCYEDVLSFLRREQEYIPEVETRKENLQLTLEEEFIMEIVREGPLTMDEIMEKAGPIPVSRMLAILASLEVKDAIILLPGGKYTLKGT